jgi:hypothetical protein
VAPGEQGHQDTLEDTLLADDHPLQLGHHLAQLDSVHR